MSPVFAVVALVKSPKGWLLTSRRNKPDNFGLPGGKVDPGETPYAAIIRELWEETGMKGYDPRLVYFAPEITCGGKLVAFFTLTVDHDMPLNPEANIVVKWGSLEEVVKSSSAFHHSNRIMLDTLGIPLT